MRQQCMTRGLESNDMKDMALIVAHVNLDVNSYIIYILLIYVYIYIFTHPSQILFENESCIVLRQSKPC